MNRIVLVGLLLCLIAGGVPASVVDAPHRFAAETVVVARAGDPDSIAIAEAYREMRGIPEENVIRLALPDKLILSRQEFVEKLFNPLRAELIERKLFLGDFVGETDALGRKPVLVIDNRVRYLVLCRGVPLKVGEGGKEADAPILEGYLRKIRRATGNREFVWQGPMMKTQASVDSELCLLAENDWPITSVVGNPLYNELPGSRASSVIRVTRLDGPTREAVLQILKDVQRVERAGLKGRAYFDWRSISQGAYKIGDDWIKAADNAVEAAHFDTSIDASGGVFGVDARMDAPAIYVGWYTTHVAGPFTLEGFRFAPGAIALHLHSFSANDPRDPKQYWVGPLVGAGAAATVGNVYEPYLGQTHDFGRLIRFLLEGNNLADAAFASIPSLSWQSVVFGDPLYEPFKVTLPEMIPGARRMEDPALDPYVILREMNRLVGAGLAADAEALGIAMFGKNRHPALALRISQMALAAGDGGKIRAKLWLRPFATVKEFSAQDWMLYVEIARELAKLEENETATAIYRHLLEDGRQPRPLEKVLLREGSAAAIWSAPEESAQWKARYEAIVEAERIAREEAEAKKRAEEEAKAAREAAAAAPQPPGS